MHCAAAGFAANAAHAEGDATMMSTPYVLRGDAAGRKTSGEDVLVTFTVDGKEISRESATFVLSEEDALQGSVTLAVAMGAVELHVPAVIAVVDGEERHLQDVHPAVWTAEEEQQQPPKQRFVPQSKGDAHVSPGFTVRHAPLAGAHAEQPRSAEELEQQ